jgi:hypothetical protein
MSFLKFQMNFIKTSKTSCKKTKNNNFKNHLDVITLTISCPIIFPSNNCSQSNFPHLPLQVPLLQTHFMHLLLQTHKFLHFKTPQTFQQQKSNTFFLCKLYTQNLLKIIIPLIAKIIKIVFLHKTYPHVFSLSTIKHKPHQNKCNLSFFTKCKNMFLPFPLPHASHIKINATFLSLQNVETCFFPFHRQM